MGKAMTDNLIETQLTSNDQSRFTEMLSPYLKLADELIMQLLSITGLSGEEGPVMDLSRRPAPRGGGGGRRRSDSIRRTERFRTAARSAISCSSCRAPLPGPRRMLMAHTDTVPICRGAKPVKKGKYIVPGRQDHRTGRRRPQRHGRYPGRRALRPE